MNRQKGFTLVELSIVLIIIGLIISGVLTGKSLIYQARVRAVISDFNELDTAWNLFYIKYDGIPGDLADAHLFWPGCNSGAANSDCSGNGDGWVDAAGANSPFTVNNLENVRAWQHYTLAGLIAGEYSGVGTSSYGHTLSNSPTAMDGRGIYMYSYSNQLGYDYNELVVGAIHTDNSPYAGLFTPTQVHVIDKKLDNGVSITGSFYASTGIDYGGEGDICRDGGSPPHLYNLSEERAVCFMRRAMN